MRGEKLSSALGKIDDRLVMSVVPVPEEKQRSPWPVILTAAAVLACLLAVPQVVRQFRPNPSIDPPPVTDPPIDPPPVTDPSPDVEKVLRHLHLPTLSRDFPATVSEAEDRGIVLQTLAQWGEPDALLPVYEVTPELPVVGEYPCWTPEQAMDRLMEGYGYCNMEEPILEPLIHEVGLVYLEFEDINDDYMPYYWFSVKLGTGEEGLYFLPAIHDEHLYCVAWWKEQGCDTIEERLRLTPDDDGISFEVRDAFAAFITEQGLEDKYRDPDYYLQLYKKQVDGMGEVAVLYCSGPLLVNMAETQCFHYVYEQAEVVWGPSGNWYSAQTDLAQTIRRMLLYRDAEDAGGQKEYDRLVREAFAQYFIENPDLLWYLPEFDAETPPDRDDLLLFTMLQGSLDTTSFTAEEMDAVIARLMEGVTFEHGPANNLQLENGVYTYLPYGLPYEPVYYRPEACVWNAQNNTWTLTLSGYAFSEEDFWEDSTEHSANWNALWSYLGQNADPDTALSAQPFGSLILPLLYDEEVVPLPEEIGMKATETLKVTFRLQEGNHPLRFVSCKREILS